MNTQNLKRSIGRASWQSFLSWDFIISFILFFLIFIIYVRLLVPTIFTGDSADATIASYVLGIPHPPGFPVYTWFGHLFTLLPIGDIAYRVNLMSAFFGALTIPVVYMIIRSFSTKQIGNFADGASRCGAIVGSLSLAFCVYYWAQAEIAEVYTLNSFFLASIILLALVWAEIKDIRLLYALSLLYSLSIGVHASDILFAPSILIFLFLVDRQALLDKRALFSMVAIFFAVGAVQLLYLFVRAWQEPAYAYSDIRTFDSFLHFITASEYSAGAFSGPLSSGISMYVNLLAQSFSLIGIALGIIGIALSLKRDLLRSGFLASLFAITMLFYVQFSSFDVPDKLNPSFMIFSIFIGLAIWEIVDLIIGSNWINFAIGSSIKGFHFKFILIGVILIFTAIAVPINSYKIYSQEIDQSVRASIGHSYFLAEALDAVPANSTIIDQWHNCTPLRYFQIVYHMNPTVRITGADPADWLKCIDEGIKSNDVFMLIDAENMINNYTEIPFMNMPGFGVLYKVYQRYPSFSMRNPTMQYPINKLMGGKIKLMGYNLDQTKEKDRFSITYYWQNMENVSKDYICALDLIDYRANVAMEDVHIPIYGIYPTSQWRKNDMLEERYNISLPPNIEPGTYQMFMVGTWNMDESADYDKVLLGSIEVGRIDVKDALVGVPPGGPRPSESH